MWATALVVAVVILVATFSSNPEENLGSTDHNLFEGDMILTPEQKAAAMAGQDVDAPVTRGSINRGTWKGGVMYYKIDRGLRSNNRAMNAIRAGMKMWSDATCVRFEEASRERSYANFQNGGGCPSYVGQTGRPQPITLASGCWTPGIVAHEIGHALVQTETTTLPFIVKISCQFNFNKYDRSKIDSLGTPCDYGSVMHHDSRAFSRNGRPTIVARKPGVQLGNRHRLSNIDIQQMNLLYKCSGGGGGGGPEPPQSPPPPTPPSECRDTGRYCSYHVPRGDCKRMQIELPN